MLDGALMNSLHSFASGPTTTEPGYRSAKSAATELINAICSARYVSGMIAKFANDAFPNAVVSSCTRFCMHVIRDLEPGRRSDVHVPASMGCTGATRSLQATISNEFWPKSALTYWVGLCHRWAFG